MDLTAVVYAAALGNGGLGLQARHRCTRICPWAGRSRPWDLALVTAGILRTRRESAWRCRQLAHKATPTFCFAACGQESWWNKRTAASDTGPSFPSWMNCGQRASTPSHRLAWRLWNGRRLKAHPQVLDNPERTYPRVSSSIRQRNTEVRLRPLSRTPDLGHDREDTRGIQARRSHPGVITLGKGFHGPARRPRGKDRRHSATGRFDTIQAHRAAPARDGASSHLLRRLPGPAEGLPVSPPCRPPCRPHARLDDLRGWHRRPLLQTIVQRRKRAST